MVNYLMNKGEENEAQDWAEMEISLGLIKLPDTNNEKED